MQRHHHRLRNQRQRCAQKSKESLHEVLTFFLSNGGITIYRIFSCAAKMDKEFVFNRSPNYYVCDESEHD